jgi:hypothetical protein
LKWWAIALCFVFVLGFSGCDSIKDFIGEGEPAPEKPEEPVPEEPDVPDTPKTDEPAPPSYVDGASGEPNIKAKFKDSKDKQGKAGVEAAFKELSAFIKDGGLASAPDVIKLGNYIDLEVGLTVTETVPVGSLSEAQRGKIDLDFSEPDDKPKLRLIVVGINSFQEGGHDGQSAYQGAGTPPQPPHVVFHFADVPGTHRMNPGVSGSTPEGDSTGGSPASEMRTYVIGNFLDELKTAGVPEEVLWPPTRTLSIDWANENSPEYLPQLLTDLLWLPTMWEMFGTNLNSSSKDKGVGETAANQARLEYYADAACGKSSPY